MVKKTVWQYRCPHVDQKQEAMATKLDESWQVLWHIRKITYRTSRDICQIHVLLLLSLSNESHLPLPHISSSGEWQESAHSQNLPYGTTQNHVYHLMHCLWLLGQSHYERLELSQCRYLGGHCFWNSENNNSRIILISVFVSVIYCYSQIMSVTTSKIEAYDIFITMLSNHHGNECTVWRMKCISQVQKMCRKDGIHATLGEICETNECVANECVTISQVMWEKFLRRA